MAPCYTNEAGSFLYRIWKHSISFDAFWTRTWQEECQEFLRAVSTYPMLPKVLFQITFNHYVLLPTLVLWKILFASISHCVSNICRANHRVGITQKCCYFLYCGNENSAPDRLLLQLGTTHYETMQFLGPNLTFIFHQSRTKLFFTISSPRLPFWEFHAPMFRVSLILDINTISLLVSKHLTTYRRYIPGFAKSRGFLFDPEFTSTALCNMHTQF